jgi:hypothetical protein
MVAPRNRRRIMGNTASGSLAERREHWRGVIAEWRASGNSQTAFCRERGIPAWKLQYWLKRLADGGPVADAPAFAAVSAPGSGLRVALPGGLRLELEAGFDEATLLRFLRVAGAAC